MEKSKSQNSSKKLIIAVVALCVALLCVVGALIGVYAASTQSLKSTFNVNYSVGSGIAAKANATYEVGGVTKNMTTDGKAEAQDGSNTILEFNVNDSNTTPGALSIPENVELSTTNQSILFVFYFQNIGEKTIQVSTTWIPELNSEYKNIKWGYQQDKYEVGSTSIPEINITTTSYSDESVIDVEKSIGTYIYGTELSTNGEIVRIAFKVEVDNPNMSAYFKSTETNPLTFNLNYLDK